MTEPPKRGGRRVELSVPVTYAGVEISAVDIAPVRLDHVVRWGEGKIPGVLALLAELSSLEQGALRAITYPDVDHVMSTFMTLLPAEIRTDVDRGVTHLAAGAAVATATGAAPTSAADFAAVAAAAAAEEDTGSGFDMSERP